MFLIITVCITSSLNFVDSWKDWLCGLCIPCPSTTSYIDSVCNFPPSSQVRPGRLLTSTTQPGQTTEYLTMPPPYSTSIRLSSETTRLREVLY